jgi:ATP-dependent RNA helicase RhlE
MSFIDFNLSEPLLRAIKEKGYLVPTPIQQQAIPDIILGRDLLGCAQTGTGKTAAFCIPILQRLQRRSATRGIRALILTPTRELAIQIADNLKAYGKHLPFRHTLVYGGVSQHQQVKDIRNGVDILVATPGRLMDLINQRVLTIKDLEILVLDEADRMLDMGFINDIKRIIALTPKERQNIFFSATMPKEINDLVASLLKNPVTVKIAESKKHADNIHQSVYYVDKSSKRALLKHIIKEKNMANVLVFTKTKHGADRIAGDLNKSGISAEAFHGDKTQNARVRALNNFKRNTTRVLVATDIAARGIDIVDLPYVINFELPPSSETYTHRIGRTGRAGAKGSAVSLCDTEERVYLKNINKISSRAMDVVEHPFG